MKEQELCKKRLMDLSRQAAMKDIVVFSDFLNLNELNIYHTIEKMFPVQTYPFGGYSDAERQMIAFIPDAFSYETTEMDRIFPIRCLWVVPKYPKYAEKLTHRDLLGALMSLGIERSKLGDILCFENEYAIFCTKSMLSFLLEHFSQVRHTAVALSEKQDFWELHSHIQWKERYDTIASNRIDCIIAKALSLSRSEAAMLLAAEKVFLNGKTITNCNQTCPNGGIISVRGKTRFIFETCNTLSKKGKLRVKFSFYQ